MGPPPIAERALNMRFLRKVMDEMMASNSYRDNQVFFDAAVFDGKTLRLIRERLETGYCGLETFKKSVVLVLGHAKEVAYNDEETSATNALTSTFKRVIAQRKKWLEDNSPAPDTEPNAEEDQSEAEEDQSVEDDDQSETSNESPEPTPAPVDTAITTNQRASSRPDDADNNEPAPPLVKAESLPADPRPAKRQRTSASTPAQLDPTQPTLALFASAQSAATQSATTQFAAAQSAAPRSAATQPVPKFQVGDLVIVNAPDSPLHQNSIKIAGRYCTTPHSIWHYQLPVIPGKDFLVPLPEEYLAKVKWKPGNIYSKPSSGGSTCVIRVDKVTLQNGRIRYHGLESVHRDPEKVFTTAQLAELLPEAETKVVPVDNTASGD